MISVRSELAEYREGWREAWALSRQDGFPKAIPKLIMGVLLTVAGVSIILAAKAYYTAILVWSRLNPSSPYNRQRRAFRRMLVKTADQVVLSAPGRVAGRADLFFGRLPPEIRRHILLLAFGDQTVHMDLQLERPLNLAAEKSVQHWAIHARIDGLTPMNTGHLVPGKEKSWRWFSCVCHRFPPDRNPYLPFGRRRNYPWSHFQEPNVERCLEGCGHCNEWPGEWPVKCQIGIMGWLLSCRQAYLEGIDVLYRTNTIHISSPVLMRSMQDIVSRQRLADITSLELVWKPKQLPLRLGFTGHDSSSLTRSSGPLFPSLVYLRISFTYLTMDEVDEAVGLVWLYEDEKELSRRLHDRLYPEIDDLLDRMVPASTDVTVSCCKWDWYVQTDLYLVEKQGKERTKTQRADIEGLKCWRETPKRQTPDAGLEDATRAKREGYWIHVGIDDTHLDSGMSYDWHRHELYDLGEKRYRYC